MRDGRMTFCATIFANRIGPQAMAPHTNIQSNKTRCKRTVSLLLPPRLWCLQLNGIRVQTCTLFLVPFYSPTISLIPNRNLCRSFCTRHCDSCDRLLIFVFVTFRCRRSIYLVRFFAGRLCAWGGLTFDCFCHHTFFCVVR